MHAQTENGVENMVVCTPELTTLKDEVRMTQNMYCLYDCVLSTKIFAGMVRDNVGIKIDRAACE